MAYQKLKRIKITKGEIKHITVKLSVKCFKGKEWLGVRNIVVSGAHITFYTRVSYQDNLIFGVLSLDIHR